MIVNGRWELEPGRGRPKGNQAGLPATRGIDSRRSDGLQRTDKWAMPRWNYTGGSQARLILEQRQTEYITADDSLDQRTLAAKCEEADSAGARRDTERFERRIAFRERAAYQSGRQRLKRELGVGDYGVC
ncbi:hypothetical protein A3K55_00365 [Candidatus Shapirobacteria bacterium RBG_13_44_7]|uniref:Uncharacterized protein n=1 Tax=Candidatus Shapirobacteria bacterium RBG_13_44_7 TaxID=1802149 RepID=A0A1F7SGM4_9BACT|nr:MAG: hypothetical protein A3K55_00365 [Candidatus Shapirobacteria bacterium RBG_13_44_7]